MASLHTGPIVADNEIEHVRAELDQFNRIVGPEILKTLTGFIRSGKTATIRTQIFVIDGRIDKVQIQGDYTIALDERPRA